MHLEREKQKITNEAEQPKAPRSEGFFLIEASEDNPARKAIAKHRPAMIVCC
jgi:hypothetical protein